MACYVCSGTRVLNVQLVLIQPHFVFHIVANQPAPDKDKEVVIGVSITLGLVTTLLFIAPCFAISYWSSRQSARAKPGVPRTVRYSHQRDHITVKPLNLTPVIMNFQ